MRAQPEVLEAILALLTERGPCSPSVICAATGASASGLSVRLRPLLASGRIIASKNGAYRRYGLAGSDLSVALITVHARPNAVGKPKRPVAPPRSADERLQDDIERHLGYGASVEPKALARILGKTLPGVSTDRVHALLEERWRNGLVERFLVGESTIRYRKLAKRKAVAA